MKPNPTEKQITKAILDYLNTIRNSIALKFYAGGLKFGDKWIPQGKEGVSDILACVNSKFVAIEVKKKGRLPTEAQGRFLQNIRDAGGIAGVCRSIDDVVELLKGG